MKKFAMSMFASNEALLEAKCLYMEKQYNLMRDVAVAADIVHDTYSHQFEGNEDFNNLKKALEKSEL